MKTLFHCSAWKLLADAEIGQEYTLIPGRQCAEGLGVYFSEGKPRPQSSDSCVLSGMTAIIAIEVSDEEGWWISKLGKSKKFGKPRTWHSEGKSVSIRVDKIEDGVIHCFWRWQ